MTNQHAYRVLIVDDILDNIKILARFLEKDYSIQVATDGESALELISRPHRPDLVLLDLPQDNPLRPDIENILNACTKGCGLIEQIRAKVIS